MRGIPRIGRDKTLAVVDVGSGHVGCALISLPAKGSAIVLGHARSLLSLEERMPDQSRARVGEEVAEAVKGAYAAAGEKARGRHVSAVYAVIHAPWTVSEIVASSESYPEVTLIRAPHIVRLAQASLAQNTSLDRAAVFETSVVSTRLNGYSTSAPEGKRARRMDIASVMSTCDPQLRANVESAIQAAFPAAKTYFRSAERVYADILRRVNDAGSAVIVSLGILATHIIVVRDGVPTDDRVVGEGLRNILARVHSALPPAETIGLFRMLERDACASEACTALQKAVAEAEPELAKIFGESFGSLAQTRRLPNSLVLVAQEDITGWLSAFFGRIDFTQFTLTTLPFSTSTLDAEHLSAWVAADDSLDSALGLAAAHVVVEEQST